MAWNDDIDEQDLQDVAFWNRYVNAVNERRRAMADVVPAATYAALAEYAAGDDVQAVASVTRLQSAVRNLVRESGGQYNGWVRTGSGATARAYTTLEQFATDCGVQYSSGSIFRRFYPKSIATLAATSRTDGVAAADGDKVFCNADGRRYERVSGEWVEIFTQHDYVSATGLAQAGDYLGKWLFEDMRAALNVMEDVLGNGLTSEASRPSASVSIEVGRGGTTYGTTAGARAALESAWAAASPGNSGTRIVRSFEFQITNDPDFTAGWEWSVSALQSNDTSGVPHAFDAYVWIESPRNSVYQRIFDAQGSGLAEGWSQIAFGESGAVDWLPTPGAKPATLAWGPEITGVSTGYQKGWGNYTNASEGGRSAFLIGSFTFTERA